MKWSGYIMVLAFLLVFNGCVMYRTYTLEIAKPASIIPSTVNGGLLLVNNTAPQPANVGQYYVIYNVHGKDSMYNVPCRVDSFADLMLGYLAAHIKSEDFIKKIRSVSAIKEGLGGKRGSSAYLRGDSLSKSQRSYINTRPKASLLVSLDGLLVESEESDNTNNYNNLGPGMPPLKRTVYVHSAWRVYDGMTDSMLLRIKRLDSLVWRVESVVTGKPLPPIESTLPEIADYVAGEVYRLYTPFWERTERFYYVSGCPQLKLGADEVSLGNWEKAAEYWKSAYDKGKRLNPFRASVNLMLYSEQKGDIQGAYIWAQRANVASNAGLYSPTLDEWYAFKEWYKDIRLRLEELERLNAYLDGFVE